ncbi:double zinc ribbon domain-containing protein [Halobacterium zhouii]|uniref:double zinc ribbon domain-containing protein n=1 Tax=Halobacterium zhouii TaxID=2902624 RepID=UPI001E6361AA|nr:zinc ribbon domain-containing protein [Halobacterium zhouii]
MSKITFRADSDLVDAVEAMDASKSEVMRDALRAYLERSTAGAHASPLDAVLTGSSDARVDHRFDEEGPSTRDVNVRVMVESSRDQAATGADRPSHQRASSSERHRATNARGEREQTCTQCGNTVAPDHAYCPSCGEKATRRVFCECGDEVRADWAFCPHCGRRTTTGKAFDK